MGCIFFLKIHSEMLNDDVIRCLGFASEYLREGRQKRENKIDWLSDYRS